MHYRKAALLLTQPYDKVLNLSVELSRDCSMPFHHDMDPRGDQLVLQASCLAKIQSELNCTQAGWTGSFTRARRR
jgi:hypothetical protein